MLHNSLRKWSAALAVAAALATGPAARAQSFTPPPYPRIGGIQIGTPYDYNDPTYQAELARQSVMILGYYPGLSPGGTSFDSDVKAIKAINPNALVFLYTNSDEQMMNPANDADASLINQLNSMQWWLYTNTTFSTPVPSFFGNGGYTINNTPNTPKDAEGDDSIDYITKWFVDNFYTPNPDIDGFFMDNVFTAPRVAGDWYRDNQDLPDTSASAASALQSGYERWFSLARQLMPGKYQIGNIATWYLGTSSLPSGYQSMVDGGVMEAMIGESYSVETYAGWQAMMTQYYDTMGSLNSPQLGIFNQWGSPTDYQSMRYGLASCLMNNAYYSFTSSAAGYTGVVWFDEYNANLGTPISAPPTAAWQDGVWRRDFTNGIALVNPKGNGPQTVQLGGTFVKLKGTQDPEVNSGETVTSVTLEDRDGIILLRTTPVSTSSATSTVSSSPGSPATFTPGGDTFGQSSVVGTPSAGLTANYERGSEFTLATQGVLASLSAYLDGDGGGSGSQSLRMALYQDSDGIPGDKVAESNTVSVAAGQAAGWVTFSVSAASLSAGNYWIVIESGDTAGIARDYGGGAADWYGSADTFAYGGANPFGAGAAGTDTLSVYASYYPGSAQQLGRTTVGSAPSAGLTADYKRGSKFTLSSQGALVDFSAYLDGNGGAAGTQDVRMDLYQDSDGVPGAKVAESSTVAIPAGQPGGWVSFAAPATALAPGNYWLIIHSGGTAGIARDYGDGAADWYGNADPFSDGGSDPFGSGAAGTDTLSVNATYVPTQAFGRTTAAATPSAGLTANYKRGSRFTLGTQGSLISFSAYLDGDGGGSGGQSLRMALYQDDNGVPSALVAVSNPANVTAGQAAGWVTFSAPAVSLNAGTYWIVIESGDNTGIARDYGDGAAGTDTLSVYASISLQ